MLLLDPNLLGADTGWRLSFAIGGILGYAVVSLVSLDGPRFGLPQMMISQRWFGRAGNVYPAFLAFLAGVGWFSVDCIFGAQAVGALLHVPYLVALALTLYPPWIVVLALVAVAVLVGQVRDRRVPWRRLVLVGGLAAGSRIWSHSSR